MPLHGCYFLIIQLSQLEPTCSDIVVKLAKLHWLSVICPIILFYLVIAFITIWNYWIILLIPSPPSLEGRDLLTCPSYISASKEWQILCRCSRIFSANSLSWNHSKPSTLIRQHLVARCQWGLRHRGQNPALCRSVFWLL